MLDKFICEEIGDGGFGNMYKWYINHGARSYALPTVGVKESHSCGKFNILNPWIYSSMQILSNYIQVLDMESIS